MRGDIAVNDAKVQPPAYVRDTHVQPIGICTVLLGIAFDSMFSRWDWPDPDPLAVCSFSMSRHTRRSRGRPTCKLGGSLSLRVPRSETDEAQYAVCKLCAREQLSAHPEYVHLCPDE